VAGEVLVEYADRIAIMTMNRPHPRNAINHAVSVGVAQALEELDERDDLTVGVITGAGGTFSSGRDLKAFLAAEAQAKWAQVSPTRSGWDIPTNTRGSLSPSSTTTTSTAQSSASTAPSGSTSDPA
jgi:enoyl-CoA hydratase/carnithine racemase